MAETNLQSMPNGPTREPGIFAYASVPAGVAIGWMVPQALLKNSGAFVRNGVATVGAIGLGYLAASTFLKPAQTPQLPIPQGPVAQPLFLGFSEDTLPSPERSHYFMQYTTALAANAPPYDPQSPTSPLNNIVRNLAEKGLTQQAARLRKHLMIYGSKSSFYQALDGWLEEIARTRPETAEHIQRQSVLLALAIENVPPEYREKAFIQATFAGMLHDVGKLAIAPQLLDKSSRIDRPTMKMMLESYAVAVPDYPEKQDDMKFLEMVNGGRVFFAKSSPYNVEPLGVKEYLKRIENQPLAGEPGFADDVMKVSSDAIFARILKTYEDNAGLRMFNPKTEVALLNRSRRGTLTEQEGKVMALHDQFGVEMVKAIGIPKEIDIEPEVMNMGKGVEATIRNPEHARIRELVMISDIAEAVTGQRAYNRENGKNLTPDEAIQVLQREASEHGMLPVATVEHFAKSGIMQRYAALYPDIPTQRGTPAMQIQAGHVQHAKEIAPEMVAQL